MRIRYDIFSATNMVFSFDSDGVFALFLADTIEVINWFAYCGSFVGCFGDGAPDAQTADTKRNNYCCCRPQPFHADRFGNRTKTRGQSVAQAYR
ncbi:MAG: hypothetical protein LBC20_11345 [Planctomycetaceae bacterium]|nr:hypothetical protein [Planctomycetaceae bacterium]